MQDILAVHHFSTIALLNSFVYYFFLYRDLKTFRKPPKFGFSVFFCRIVIIRRFFTLSYMMATKTWYQELYLASTYFYLHFQYNGFLFFHVRIALLSPERKGILISSTENKNDILVVVHRLFHRLRFIGFMVETSCLDLSSHCFGNTCSNSWRFFFKWIKKSMVKIKTTTNPLQRFVFIYVGFAFAVKILLQLGSVIPAVSQFAFGFRNVVIAYLHLILLMCVATFY